MSVAANRPAGLSSHQAQALARIESNGSYQFDGRWRKTIDCLVRRGLVRADYELVRRRGKTVWLITAYRKAPSV